MGWVLLLLLPVATFAALDLVCRGEPPAIWRRLAPVVSRWLLRRRQLPPQDVFDTLRVQTRLGAVADEILRLESDRSAFARAARLQAIRRAYDDLLTEACQLAGVGLGEVGSVEGSLVDAGPIPNARSGDDLQVRIRNSDAARTNAELELASRGWSW